MSARPVCSCGHGAGVHEIRSGGLFGCIIVGCRCIDFTDCTPATPPAPGIGMFTDAGNVVVARACRVVAHAIVLDSHGPVPHPAVVDGVLDPWLLVDAVAATARTIAEADGLRVELGEVQDTVVRENVTDYVTRLLEAAS